MTTKPTPGPQHFAQKVKAGRGWLITRNSATLADTDYEHVADEIINALNAQAEQRGRMADTPAWLDNARGVIAKAKQQ